LNDSKTLYSERQRGCVSDNSIWRIRNISWQVELCKYQQIFARIIVQIQTDKQFVRYVDTTLLQLWRTAVSRSDSHAMRFLFLKWLALPQCAVNEKLLVFAWENRNAVFRGHDSVKRSQNLRPRSRER
jgi:hypothetical protein